MFLSRVEIPWEFARNSYDLHRQLWRLFPGEEKETRRNGEELRQGFLFRIEDNPTGRPARLLVRSRRAPVAASGVGLVGTREIQPQPVAGQRLAFLLTANPVKTIADAQRDAKPGKKSEKCRVPLMSETVKVILLRIINLSSAYSGFQRPDRQHTCAAPACNFGLCDSFCLLPAGNGLH